MLIHPSINDYSITKQTINLDKCCEQLFRNYKQNHNAILKQFLLDFNREDVYIDNVRITNIHTFLNFIQTEYCSKYNKQNDNDDYEFYLQLLILFQQTIFSIPIEHLHNAMNGITDQNVLTECKYAICENVPPSAVKILLTTKTIQLIKKLRIINIQSHVKTYDVIVVICYDFVNKNVVFHYNLLPVLVTKYGFELID